MTRIHLLATVTLVLAGAIGAVAQGPPNQPYRFFNFQIQPAMPAVGFGRPLELKGLGKVPERNAQVVGNWWADRLIADLEQFKSEVAGVRIAPVSRRALDTAADNALDKAFTLEKVLGQNRRDLWYRATGDVEAALAELTKVAAVHARGEVTVLAALDRANYAGQQITVAVAIGDNNADNQRRVIARLAAAQEEQGERLRFMVEQLGAPGNALEREVRQFVRFSQQLTREATGNANLERLKREMVAVATEWGEVEILIAKLPNIPPLIRYQANRVDGLNRQLIAMLIPNAPPPNPVPPGRPQKVSVLAVGAGNGMEPRVVVYSDDKGTVAQSFYAYNRQVHRDGVRVAVADLNGDGLPEVVTINGGQGHARLKVFDGRDTNPIIMFDGFEQKVTPWGYFVAAADLTRDGRALVAIAPDAGGPPVVEVYDLAQGKLLGSIQAFPRNFEGGVRIAWGDVNGDGTPDLIAASGPGQIASAVRVFDGTNFTRVIGEFLGVDEKYKGGLWVAAADLTKNNHAEIIVGLDGGSRPLVRVFDGTKAKFVAEFEPYPRNFQGGVRVAVGDPDDGARLKIICSPGNGANLPIRILRLDGKVHSELDPFPRSSKGMFVGSR